MGRPLRYIPEGGALVEVTVRAQQGRYLLRPDPQGRVNELVLGVWGRAQRLYSMSVIAISVMSNHLHALVFAQDAEQLALFMGYVNSNLSKEIGRAHQWRGGLWERRYRAILVSEEPEAQVARLRYLLAAGVKEHLVERAIDWPGVHSARALTREHELRGWWFDRSRECAARQRGETYGRYKFATEETLSLDPLPCWGHFSVKDQRREARKLVRNIEREGRAERLAEGLEPLGALAVMSTEPHYRPDCFERSPAPRVHAFREEVKRALTHAYAWIVAAYREASAMLRAGAPNVSFPEGTFPPRMAFVEFQSGRSP